MRAAGHVARAVCIHVGPDLRPAFARGWTKVHPYNVATLRRTAEFRHAARKISPRSLLPSR